MTTPHPLNHRLTRRVLLLGAGALGAAGMVGCSSNDPLDGPRGVKPSSELVVASQQYYSNEIIAEIYAQILEDAGYTVNRQYQIGQREVYLPQMISGAIDVIPEYGGNLLQFYDKSNSATTAEEIQAALSTALPDGLRVLDYAEATDQDSYTVTRAVADQYQLVSVGDLTNFGRPVKIAANSEFATRPYGPSGLKERYGVDAEVIGVEDSGGPLTVKALVDGMVDVADIYSSDPTILTNELVVLDDPLNLILPQRVTPLVNDRVDDSAAGVLAKVSAALSSTDLQTLNARSVDEQLASHRIAGDWLRANLLIS